MRLFAAILLPVLLAAGCVKTGAKGSGPRLATASSISPTATIYPKAELKLADIEIPVEVSQKLNGKEMTVELLSYGQVFEKEIYRAEDDSFCLVDAAGEKYTEPLPLLKFPMNVGDGWRWTGTMTSGSEPHKASARVSTSTEQLLLPSGPAESVLVVVDLEIDGGSPTPATRKLRFWFAMGKGLVKRQFGIGSSREPTE